MASNPWDMRDDEPMFRTVQQLGWNAPSPDPGRTTPQRQSPGTFRWSASAEASSHGDGPYVSRISGQSPLLLTGAGHFSPSPQRHGSPSTDMSDDWDPRPKTAYEVLGVSETASQEDIRAAYKRGALKYHPDRNKSPGAESKFKKIAEAFALLGNVERRKEYDSLRRRSQRQREGRSNTTPKCPSFRSTFVPEPEDPPQPYFEPSFESFRAAPPGPDLRNLDAQFLFAQMFPGMSDVAGGLSESGRFSVRNRTNASSAFDVDAVLEHAFFNNSPFAGSSRKHMKMEENHQSMHMSKHGRLNVDQSHKSIKMNRGGGFTFEFHSFSGSFGSGNGSGGVMQALLAGLAGAGQPPTRTPLAPSGSEFASRARRQSLGASDGHGEQVRRLGHRKPSFEQAYHVSPALGLTADMDDLVARQQLQRFHSRPSSPGWHGW